MSILIKKIFLESKHIFIEDYLQIVANRLGLSEKDRLGSGLSGIAYRYNGKVLKITHEDVEMLEKIVNKDLSFFSKIYSIKKIEIEDEYSNLNESMYNVYIIIKEYLTPLSSIDKKLVYKICNDNFSDLKKELKFHPNERMEFLIKNYMNVVHGLEKVLNVSRFELDLNQDNIGWKNEKLAAFDL